MKRILTAVLFLFIFSGAAFAQTSQEDFRKMADHVYSVFSSGDYSSLSNYIEADMIEHSPFPGQKPGLEGVIQSMQMMKEAYPDMRFEIVDAIWNGVDKGSILFKFTGTNTGSWFGMPATGKKVEIMGLEFLKFNSSGKATDHWGYVEEMKMMEQLGLMPAPDQK